VSDALDKVKDVTYQLPVEDGESASWNLPPSTRQATYDVLVLDARLRQSLATIRSLGSRGLRVATIGSSARLPSFSSRWCKQAFICPADEGTEAYLLYLEQLLDHIRARVLITSSDATLALVRRHRERLEQLTSIALAKEPALGIAINKERTLEVARQLGLSVPKGVNVKKASEVAQVLSTIGLPAVVKPAESWVWNKQHAKRPMSKLVRTLDEAQQVVEELESFGVTMIIQQLISGRRESVSLFYAKGQIYACYAQRHTRIVGGESALRESIAVPQDIGRQAERLVREIDLEGCAEVEFRRDDAGNPYLMEINPRLWASTELAIRSGVDFPNLLYQWANGEKIDMVKSYPTGGRLRNLKGDILHVATSLSTSRQQGIPEREVASPSRAIFDFCLSFFIPMGYDCLDWRDPLPVLTVIVGFARDVLRWMGKNLRRKVS
jgi:predicted ATP-grasp superfamily ATP-dependent carboligase